MGLIYFLNRFDATPDFYLGIDYLDDEWVVDEAWKEGVEWRSK